MKPGNYKQMISVGGMERLYLLHVPTRYDGSRPLPLLFILHGFGGNATSMVKLTGMDDKADQENFLVAYLNGTEVRDPDTGSEGQAWNNGLNSHLDFKADDVAFVRELITHLEEQLNVDSRRIYATGLSSGAGMSNLLGAELPDLLAGVAIVAGTIGLKPAGESAFETIPAPGGAIPVMIIHGKADTHILYDGGQATEGQGLLNAMSVAEEVAFWVEADACAGTSQTETSSDGNVITVDYASCAAGSEVLLYTIVNGKHEWPTAQGHTHFSATDAIWEFFSRHPQ
jgi:polyhydroxybutyrate depolymerase